MVDVWVEILFAVLSFFMISSLALIPENPDFESTYHWVYSNRMLLSYLGYKHNNLSMLNIARHASCTNSPDFDALSREILDIANKGYNYILYSPEGFHVYNTQESVCMEELRINSFVFNTSCGENQMLFAIWSREVPEVC